MLYSNWNRCPRFLREVSTDGNRRVPGSISANACFQQLTVTMFENMRVRITITESQGDGEAAQALISERIIETESHKRLTAKRAGQILSREYPELGDNAKRVVRMPQ